MRPWADGHHGRTRVAEVDYLATSLRPPFDALPARVRAAVGEVAGSPVVGCDPPVRSGFGGATAGLVHLDDGSRVFVKVAGPSMPQIRSSLAREATLLPRVARLRTPSRMVGALDVEARGAWFVLVLEAIDGTQPGGPWTAEDADAVEAACREVAGADEDLLAALDLGTAADELAGGTAGVPALRRLSTGAQPWPEGFAVPAPDAAADLARLSTGVLDAVAGPALVHLDVRPDNLLRERDGRMRVVDWNQASLGAPWLDLVSLWPLMHHHGVDVGRFDGSPLLVGASPDDVDAFLAFLVGFMLENAGAPPPPGCTEALRRHQVFYADTAVRLLADRRGWTVSR